MNMQRISFAPTHRQAVATLGGVQVGPVGQLSLDPATLSLIAGGASALIPSITGKAASDVFAASAASIAAQDAEAAKQRRLAALGITTVTVVGLGLLTWLALRK